MEIWEGTSEVEKLTIARTMFREMMKEFLGEKGGAKA